VDNIKKQHNCIWRKRYQEILRDILYLVISDSNDSEKEIIADKYRKMYLHNKRILLLSKAKESGGLKEGETQ